MDLVYAFAQPQASFVCGCCLLHGLTCCEWLLVAVHCSKIGLVLTQVLTLCFWCSLLALWCLSFVVSE